MNIKIVTMLGLGAFLLTSTPLFAQNEDDANGYDNYYDYDSPDSSATDSGYDEGYDNYDNYDPYASSNSSSDQTKKPEKKPYVRIEMPYDTITELITYTEVVVQDESYYDSLYWRAKRFLIGQFELKDKDFKEAEEKNNMEKIIMTLQLPYELKKNKYVTENVGKLEFKLALRFKDGKYKYDIDHLKHNMPVAAAGKNQPEYVYLEYYMRAERNIIYHDQLLRSANRILNKLIVDIKKALKEPVLIDEDDW
ncbi:MAG: DUF4468 domain-containing protein [Bacteroidetes bacterium]|nr:MAG: DUF4468 domain-containing protein [Bacteroidota bacterium]